MRIDLPPTGNSNQDTANLQARLDELSFAHTGTTWEQGVLGLSGVYHLNEPLHTGDISHKPASIDGGNAVIIWAGAKTDEPMLSFGAWDDPTAGGLGFAPLISNVCLVANNGARGMRFNRLGHRCLLDHCLIYGARQVALDSIDCWGGSASNVRLKNTRGIALRTCGFNSARIDNLRVTGTRAEDFPAIDDQTVKRHDGTPVQTKENGRAAIILDGGKLTLANLLAESNRCGSAPVMHTKCMVTLDQVYFEGNDCTTACVVLQGGYGTWDGRGFTLQNVSMTSRTGCRALVELRDRTYDVLVQNGQFQGLRDCIIWAASGKHYGPTVQRCGSYANAIADDRFVLCAAGAFVQSEVPEAMTTETPP